MCWLNGRLTTLDDARIDPRDRGFTLGDGVFETLAVRDGVPVHLEAHLARLEQGAAVLGLRCPYAAADAVAALLAHAGPGCASLRITLTRGPGARGLVLPDPAAPTLLAVLGAAAPARDRVRAVVCQSTRRNALSPLSRIKSLNYLDAIVARAEAAGRGAEDAVMLNTDGAVACACAANVVALFGEVLLTPPVAEGALPGIVRAVLMRRGLVAEERLLPAALLAAQAVFLTNSLGIAQVSSLDGVEYAPAPRWLCLLQGAAA